MTRNFNQYGRNDERPYSRHSSDRYQGEQSPRPARPRPNRVSVDRAWENGARQQHPDYRPRGTYNTQSHHPTRNGHTTSSRQQGQPYQANRGRYSRDDASAAPWSRNDRKPPFQRRETRDNRYNDRPPRRFERERPFDSDRRTSDERNYSERPHFIRDGEQREQREQRPSYRDQGRPPRSQSYDRRRDDERGGAPRRFNSPGRFSRNDRQARPDQREGPRPHTPNPRFQSRPGQFSRQARNFEQRGRSHSDELFEGDYERFNAHDRAAPRDREERHVTRLPDGRVLKGRRKQQREAAAFWTGVDEERQDLIPDVEEEHKPQSSATSLPAKRATTRKPPAPRTPKESRATSKGAASAKSGGPTRKTPTKSKSARPTANATRPSKRGYKWPKPE